MVLSELVMASALRKKKHEAKILFKNQRLPAEQGSGPFQGPSSDPQLCWWSLIPSIKNWTNFSKKVRMNFSKFI